MVAVWWARWMGWRKAGSRTVTPIFTRPVAAPRAESRVNASYRGLATTLSPIQTEWYPASSISRAMRRRVDLTEDRSPPFIDHARLLR
jgi:hypothetical protein